MRRRHIHDWVLNETYVPSGAFDTLAAAPGCTVLLWRCKSCNGPESVTTQVLSGRWTHADLALEET